MIWWILLAIFVLLLILPLGVSIRYDCDGVAVLVTAGPVRIKVFPMKKKEKDTKKEESKAEKTSQDAPKEEQPGQETPPASQGEKKEEAAAATQSTTPSYDDDDEDEETAPEKKKGGNLMDFLPLVKLALKFVGEFFHKTLHIDVLYLKLTMAGGDPADLGMNYGRAWAALGNLWPYIDKMFTIKKRDIRLQCDFESSQTLVNARVDITVTLARLLGLVINYGVRIGIQFLKITFAQKKAAKAEEEKS